VIANDGEDNSTAKTLFAPRVSRDRKRPGDRFVSTA